MKRNRNGQLKRTIEVAEGKTFAAWAQETRQMRPACASFDFDALVRAAVAAESQARDEGALWVTSGPSASPIASRAAITTGPPSTPPLPPLSSLADLSPLTPLSELHALSSPHRELPALSPLTPLSELKPLSPFPALAELEHEALAGSAFPSLSAARDVRKAFAPGQIQRGLKKLRAKAKRAAAREEAKRAAQYGEYVVVPKLINKHVRPARALPTKLHTYDLGHTRNAYTGAKDTRKLRAIHSLNDFFGPSALFGEGWRKECFSGTGSIPITDASGRVVGAICGGPADPTWAESCAEAIKLIAQARTKLNTTTLNWEHRRGWFLAMAHGVSYGKGQKVFFHSCALVGHPT
ncbi:hypothetical protein HWV62_40282 [Athelia sp. TMB]|nr:hypothetical protein HWV62_40282 [Athelia sp. TMB]